MFSDLRRRPQPAVGNTVGFLNQILKWPRSTEWFNSISGNTVKSSTVDYKLSNSSWSLFIPLFALEVTIFVWLFLMTWKMLISRKGNKHLLFEKVRLSGDIEENFYFNIFKTIDDNSVCVQISNFRILLVVVVFHFFYSNMRSVFILNLFTSYRRCLTLI